MPAGAARHGDRSGALREMEAALQEQHWIAWLDRIGPGAGRQDAAARPREPEGREMLERAPRRPPSGAAVRLVARLRAALKL